MRRSSPIVSCALLLVCLAIVATFFVVERELHSHSSASDIKHQSTLSTPKSASSIIIPEKVESTPTSAEDSSIQNPPQKSRWAYVTLISGINEKLAYRGFLYNAIIMYHSLKKEGSKADFIAMIGYNFPMKSKQDASLQTTSYYSKHNPDIVNDLNLLRSHGIIVYELPRLLNAEKHPLNFAEMALLKISPYSFTQYERLQFFDGDILPTENMDCFFESTYNMYTVGLVSPLNSGWYALTPNMKDYEAMKAQAVWRLGQDWNKQTGWGRAFPTQPPNALFYRGMSKVVTLWDFNGADMDQGLYTDHFILQQGHTLLIDTDANVVRVFQKGLLTQQDEQYHNSNEDKRLSEYLSCPKIIPTDYFIHFTGQSKPWMVLSTTNDLKQNEKQLKRKAQQRTGRNVKLWLRYLDEVKLPVNSSNIADTNFGSPLGFFNANFPKGGYQG